MSHYKDSSLARTRYKRSHRIPARFDDFSEIPHELRGVVGKKTAFHIKNDCSSKPQPQSQQQPTTKYFNNITQCMQYGRLMLNEGIYLPRSVATISPITTTFQQIAEQARKPPFVSKRAEAFLSYQEERKFDLMTSNVSALVKITNYLELRDLLNLRLVNKSWKAIIDSDIVWRRVVLRDTVITDWFKFSQNLSRYRTQELIIHKLILKVSLYNVFRALTREELALKRITMTSDDPRDNRNILELLCVLNANSNSVCKTDICWRVKVYIDDAGLALIPFKKRKKSTQADSEMDSKLHCYKHNPEWMLCRNHEPFQCSIELSELTDLFNGETNDSSEMDPKFKPRIEIEPI